MLCMEFGKNYDTLRSGENTKDITIPRLANIANKD
jgi:hypothetical protein